MSIVSSDRSCTPAGQERRLTAGGEIDLLRERSRSMIGSSGTIKACMQRAGRPAGRTDRQADQCQGMIYLSRITSDRSTRVRWRARPIEELHMHACMRHRSAAGPGSPERKGTGAGRDHRRERKGTGAGRPLRRLGWPGPGCACVRKRTRPASRSMRSCTYVHVLRR